MRTVSSLLGLKVIGIADGKEIGEVTEVVYDLSTGRLVGIIVGRGAGERAISADDIAVIGEDAIMVPSGDVAKFVREVPEIAERRAEAPGKALAVVTDDGRRLGRISNVWIDPVAKIVTRFDVSAGFLQDLTRGPLSLPILEGTVHGPDTVIVPAAKVAELAGAAAGGLKAQLEKVSQRVKQEAQVAGERAAKAAEVAKEKLEQAVEAVKEELEKARTEPQKPAEEAQEAVAAEEGAQQAEGAQAPAQGEVEAGAEQQPAEAAGEQATEGEPGEEAGADKEENQAGGEAGEPCGEAGGEEQAEGEGERACE